LRENKEEEEERRECRKRRSRRKTRVLQFWILENRRNSKNLDNSSHGIRLICKLIDTR